MSSFPEEKEKPEDAEELVAKNALELLRQMNKPDLPVQNDMDISVPRVKEVNIFAFLSRKLYIG